MMYSVEISEQAKSILKLDPMPERFKMYEREPWHSRGLRRDHYLCNLWRA